LKHTKAPWSVVIVETFDTVQYHIQQDKSESAFDAEALHNRLLIEQAPVLLVELQRAVDLLQVKYMAPDDELIPLLQVILKAGGKV